jgi:Mrp family chromosome partitioning ATPase
MNTPTPVTGAEPAEKVAELLELLGRAQEASSPPADAPAPAPAIEAHAKEIRQPGKATWPFDSPAVAPQAIAQGFAVFHPKCRPETIEQFRAIRARVFLARKAWYDLGAELRVVSVLSSTPKDGKSFVATNLAAVLAATGEQRVLLLEANPCGAALHAKLQIPNRGLVEVLGGEDWFTLLHRIEPLGLYVLPLGDRRLNAIDHFDYSAMPAWLEGLRGSFDWIVIDGPAFTQTADAELMANFADASLLVVRREESSYADVQRCLERIPPDRLLGAVVAPPITGR